MEPHPRESVGVRYLFTVLDDAALLGDHVAAWEDLAACAIEPNVFYEPWMLLPAIEAFADGVALRFILVYAQTAGQPAQLCAFLPFERVSRYRGLPLAHFRLWKHKHCYLGTPLVRRGGARQCLKALLDWMATNPRGASFVEWKLIAGDGAFLEALTGALQDTGRRSFVSQRITRAVLRRRGAAEAFIAEALSSKSRKELRRLERRLGEQGDLQYCEPADAVETERWVQEFLAVEARGWKGERGSAFNCTESNRHFFETVALQAARRGRLMALCLKVGDRTVALKCNFLANEGSFAFKIAYDEAYAPCSPGVLLELENIRRFHSRPELQWMDSCAEPGHFMVNRLWLDRRTLVTTVTATGRAAGDLIVTALSLLRRLYRGLRSASPTPA